MKLTASIIVTFLLLFLVVACAPKPVIYDGPTPTSEIKIIKDESCS